MVLGDNLGHLVMAAGERLNGRLQSCAAELSAVILGLEMVQAEGWQVAKIESDCLEAVHLVNGFAEEGVLVESFS